MRKLLHVFTYLFISIAIFISYALSDGYIPAEETGETKTQETEQTQLQPEKNELIISNENWYLFMLLWNI